MTSFSFFSVYISGLRLLLMCFSLWWSLLWSWVSTSEPVTMISNILPSSVGITLPYLCHVIRCNLLFRRVIVFIKIPVLFNQPCMTEVKPNKVSTASRIAPLIIGITNLFLVKKKSIFPPTVEMWWPFEAAAWHVFFLSSSGLCRTSADSTLTLTPSTRASLPTVDSARLPALVRP